MANPHEVAQQRIDSLLAANKYDLPHTPLSKATTNY
jgi:hypothetical protein